MKRKKLFASAVAGMLAAAQMVMPVMAESDGTVNVTVQTISPIIRVEVPTSLRVSVNEFEKDNMGSQIYSTAFTMKNKSEVPVKVKVVSTQAKADSSDPDLAALTATKNGVEDAAANTKTAWLAVAAQVAKDKYDATKPLKDLTETNANVITFDGSGRTATQSFYLTAPTAAMEYQAIIVDTSANDSNAAKGKAKGEAISYAKFYLMKEYTDGDSAKITTEALLKEAVKTDDIYQIKTTGAVTRLAKDSDATGKYIDVGTSDVKGYYTMGAVKEASEFENEKVYVYGGTPDNAASVAGDSAGFRYIGKLSEASAAWVAKDIGKITIAYDIDGISQDRYNALKNSCEYGYFKSLAGKTTNGTSVMNDAATPTAIATKAAIATRLKNTTNNKVQFVLTANQLATIKAEGLTVTKITYVVSASGSGGSANPVPVDVTSAMISAAANPAPNTDGKLYAITKPDTGVASIDSIEVEYAKGDVKMTVKYTFAAQ